jgi:hypothetical protein
MDAKITKRMKPNSSAKRLAEDSAVKQFVLAMRSYPKKDRIRKMFAALDQFVAAEKL